MKTSSRKVFSALPFAMLLPAFTLHPVSGSYHAALISRPYFFVVNWAWDEWLGVIGPVLLFIYFAKAALKHKLRVLADVCCAAAVFGTFFTGLGLLFCTSSRLESFAKLQPMRAFHLLYVLFFLIAGGMLNRFLLRGKPVRLALLFVPLCTCMLLVQRNIFPADAHIEWPGAKPKNPWVDAFLWVREHTPQTAVFALDPNEMNISDEDNQGFRAIAERSMLADNCKDAGVVTMFPELAGEWMEQVKARENWRHFNTRDFMKLSRIYNVSWVLLSRNLPQPGIRQLNCPYSNPSLMVCQVPVANSQTPHVQTPGTN